MVSLDTSGVSMSPDVCLRPNLTRNISIQLNTQKVKSESREKLCFIPSKVNSFMRNENAIFYTRRNQLKIFLNRKYGRQVYGIGSNA